MNLNNNKVNADGLLNDVLGGIEKKQVLAEILNKDIIKL